VLAVSRHLGVPDDHVAAVDVRFKEAGDYAGFDETSPLARAGGKGVMIRRWKPGLATPVMLVGDGATDLEARPDVDCFLAFMGVADRPEVRAGADGAIDCLSLAPVLPLVLPDPPSDPAGREVWERGRRLAPGMFTPS
jgi:phosphoserine phosphatase